MKVQAYDFGRIEIDGHAYRSDVIVFPDRVLDHWWRKEGHALHVQDLAAILDAQPEALVLGTGYYGRMTVPEDTRAYLQHRGIDLHVANTAEAVDLFNRLQQEYACVVAAFHLTC